MQIIQAKNLVKYSIFEKDFQTFFVLKKNTCAPKIGNKYVNLVCINFNSLNIEKHSLDMLEFVKAKQIKSTTLSFLHRQDGQIVFFNISSFKTLALNHNEFEYLLPFLLANHPYEAFIYQDKVLFIKPKNKFLKINKAGLTAFKTQVEKSKLNFNKQNIIESQNNLDYVLINTKNFFY